MTIAEQQPEPIIVPVGDPNIIRTMQYFSDLAKEGKLVGVTVVGLAPTGDVYSSSALPPNAPALHVALGALSSMMADVNEMIRQFKRQMTTSPIIKPNGLHRG